jgi:hypothetical protein
LSTNFPAYTRRHGRKYDRQVLKLSTLRWHQNHLVKLAKTYLFILGSVTAQAVAPVLLPASPRVRNAQHKSGNRRKNEKGKNGCGDEAAL